ncbi:MAG: hypothetical protein NTV02_01480 [Candidatus Zambryskibacteria bacterium]|nr:hypothetical protein [Candidatus Zambryskibacteria bacterium]
MKKYILTFLYTLTFLTGSVVFAQSPQPITGEYVVLAPLPGTTKPCTGSDNGGKNCADINSYLSGFLGLAIGIGATLTFLYLGFYGFQYAVSDSASVKMENKGKIYEILTGFFLIISAYAIIRTINPKILPEDGFSIDISVPFVPGVSVVVGSGGISIQNYPIVGYNIGTYATAPNHEKVVEQTYNQLTAQLNNNLTEANITSNLRRIAPRTPLTGAMILESSRKYGVNPILLMSMMQVDSSYGTAGKGAVTFNPGNVGNMDDGRTRTFTNWQQGVDAVADWLNRHRI